MSSIPRKASVNLLVSLISRSNLHRLARRSVHGLIHEGKFLCQVQSGRFIACSHRRVTAKGVTPGMVAGDGVMTYSCRAGDCRTCEKHDCKVKPEVKFLLGMPYDETKHDPSGWWMSEKLDGVRVMWDGSCFVSRGGNLLIAPEWFSRDLPEDCMLDGVLYAGRGQLDLTSCVIESVNDARWGDIKFHVFDCPSAEDKPFEKRMAELGKIFKTHRPEHAVLIEQVKCDGKEHLEAELSRVRNHGGEGLILRQPMTWYVGSRSSTMLKAKVKKDDRDYRHTPAVTSGFTRRQIQNGRLWRLAQSQARDIDKIFRSAQSQKNNKDEILRSLDGARKRSRTNDLDDLLRSLGGRSKREISDSKTLLNSDLLCSLGPKLSHLTDEQRTAVRDLIFNYAIFPDAPRETNLCAHDIDVGEALPLTSRPSMEQQPERLKVIRDQVRYMLENDIIEVSRSRWSSPCLLYPTRDNSYKLSAHYAPLNELTKIDDYPFPVVKDVIGRIGQAKFVSKVDLLKAFWQVPMTERSKELTAFVTPHGLFQFKRMPLGLVNGLKTFQRMTDHLVHDIDNCDAFVDDIIIYSNTFEDHLRQLHQLFEKCRVGNLSVNLVKCEFVHSSINYLGHQVGGGFVKPLASKINEILAIPAPTDPHEVKSFLCKARFYHRFCANFSTVAEPLTRLYKKDPFIWDATSQHAFDQIKALLSRDPVLAAPDFTQPFHLSLQVDDFSISSVLFQEGNPHPVGNFSKQLESYKNRYCDVEKEALCLFESLGHFKSYLNSTAPVYVLMNHDCLSYVDTNMDTKSRLLKYAQLFRNYNIVSKRK